MSVPIGNAKCELENFWRQREEELAQLEELGSVTISFQNL